MNREERDKLKIAMSEWLSDKEDWNEFYTLTFKNYVDAQGDEHAPGIQRLRTAWENFGKAVCLFGARSIAVVERGESKGRLHIHGLYSGPDWLLTLGLDYWELKYGFTKTSTVTDSGSCAAYLSKYLFKSDDVELLDFGYFHGIHSLQGSL